MILQFLNDFASVFIYLLLFVNAAAMAYLIIWLFTRYKDKILLTDKDDTPSEINRLKSLYKYSDKKNTRLVSFIKSLMLRADIRNRYITPSFFIVLSVSFLVLCFILTIPHMIFLQALELSLFAATLPEVTLYLMADLTGGRLDKKYITFLGVLEKFLDIKDDISFAIIKSSHYKMQLGTIAAFCADYDFDTSHGYTPTAALDKFAEKVDNRQIQALFHTFVTCSETSGKYLMAVKWTRDNYIKLFNMRIKRKKKALSRRRSIFMLIFFIGVCDVLSFRINTNMPYLLSSTFVGQIISATTIFSFVVAFYVAIAIGHFSFD